MGLFNREKHKEPVGEAKGTAAVVTGFILEIIQVVVIALLIIVPIRVFLIQPFYVKGASMEPNFYDHEYLIINEIGYRIGEPDRGDIVVFKYPDDPEEYFIKRIIGLPNETVEITDGKIIIYNQAYPEGTILDEEYLNDVYTAGEKKVTLRHDEYYVLGDNRGSSLDSRIIGPVNEDYIIGKVWLRGWPIDKLKVFKNPEYNF